MSDPAIRDAVLESLPKGSSVRAETMYDLREALGLTCSLGRLRRAVSSLHYRHRSIILSRPIVDEGVPRAWDIMRPAL